MVELVETPEGLTLTDGVMSVRGDFARLLPRLSQQRLNRELIVRAARIKGKADPVAVDATAGLGDDSFLLAAAGFHVMLFERNETIAALLKDAILRAQEDERLSPIVRRMRLECSDSASALRSLDYRPDVVFLDPMFPAKSKDAAAKKKLQLLQQLEDPCDDEAELLDAAVTAKPKKVVVKRPLKGAPLAGMKPSYSLSGKAIRFDVLVS